MSIRALTAILEHEVFGQTARFERYAANMLYILATGQKVDPDKLERFGTQVDEVYHNPFKKTAKLKTAADIKNHILSLIRKTKKRLEGKHGPDDPGSENHAG